MIEILQSAVINVFILAMLAWMIFWDSEPTNPIRKHWVPKIQGIFIWLGLNSEWRMFSPDPPQRTIWPKVKMTLSNGEVLDWEPTPYAQLSVWEKIRYKKFLKLYREVARPDAAFHTKRNFAEYLLRRKLHPLPCTKVEIYMVFQPAPAFGAPPGTPPKTYKQRVYTFHPSDPPPA